MTEDEAKTKWCPQYRVVSQDDDDNRSTRWDKELQEYHPTLQNACCLGSRCMMWRWDKKIINQVEIEKQRYNASYGFGYHMVQPVFEYTGNGFCGLAGKP